MYEAQPEIDELVEDVSDIGLRFDVVELARLNQRSDAGPVFSPLVMPSKQRILAIEPGDRIPRSTMFVSSSMRP